MFGTCYEILSASQCFFRLTRVIDTRRNGSIPFRWGELILNHALGLPLRTRSRGYAIARALVNSPDVIFADEPTGNLDSQNSEKIIELLYRLNNDGITVLMVTHSPSLIQRATRIVKIRDGKIEGDTDT